MLQTVYCRSRPISPFAQWHSRRPCAGRIERAHEASRISAPTIEMLKASVFPVVNAPVIQDRVGNVQTIHEDQIQKLHKTIQKLVEKVDALELELQRKPSPRSFDWYRSPGWSPQPHMQSSPSPQGQYQRLLWRANVTKTTNRSPSQGRQQTKRHYAERSDRRDSGKRDNWQDDRHSYDQASWYLDRISSRNLFSSINVSQRTATVNDVDRPLLRKQQDSPICCNIFRYKLLRYHPRRKYALMQEWKPPYSSDDVGVLDPKILRTTRSLYQGASRMLTKVILLQRF